VASSIDAIVEAVSVDEPLGEHLCISVSDWAFGNEFVADCSSPSFTLLHSELWAG
jgi:hypothetical protein